LDLTKFGLEITKFGSDLTKFGWICWKLRQRARLGLDFNEFRMEMLGASPGGEVPFRWEMVEASPEGEVLIWWE
jgi:hypothetical protein